MTPLGPHTLPKTNINDPLGSPYISQTSYKHPYYHVGSLRVLNEVFYQIINSFPTVVGSEGTVNAASLRRLSFERRSYGYKVPITPRTPIHFPKTHINDVVK